MTGVTTSTEETRCQCDRGRPGEIPVSLLPLLFQAVNRGRGGSFQCRQRIFPGRTRLLQQHGGHTALAATAHREGPAPRPPAPLSFLYNCVEAVRDFPLSTAQPNFNCKSLQDGRRHLIIPVFLLIVFLLLLKYSAIIESFAV